MAALKTLFLGLGGSAVYNGLTGSAKATPMPTPVAPPSAPIVDPRIAEQAASQAARIATARATAPGRASTLLTGPSGIVTAPPVGVKTLLGQ